MREQSNKCMKNMSPWSQDPISGHENLCPECQILKMALERVECHLISTIPAVAKYHIAMTRGDSLF